MFSRFTSINIEARANYVTFYSCVTINGYPVCLVWRDRDRDRSLLRDQFGALLDEKIAVHILRQVFDIRIQNAFLAEVLFPFCARRGNEGGFQNRLAAAHAKEHRLG